MPSELRNPKNLSDWIELDYHQRLRWLRRWKKPILWGTFAIFVLGALAVVFLPSGPRMVQAGPLSSAHASFNDDCSRCHQVPFETAKKLMPWNASHRAVSDDACTKCHDGPPHHVQVRSEDAVACASCHREHRGALSLTRMEDRHCTHCHGDLKNHRKDGEQGMRFANVRSFNTDHPEFALLREDAKGSRAQDNSQLRFNHKLHLTAGMVRRPEGPSFKVGEMKAVAGQGGLLESLHRRGMTNDQAVQLNCVDCHKPDSAGRYMEPIRYDKHCLECHPLSVRLTGKFTALNAVKEQQLQEAVGKFNAEPVPHERPEVVRGVLQDRLLELVRTFRVVPQADPRLERRLPGRDRLPPLSEQEWRETREDLDRSLRVLLFEEPHRQANERLLWEGRCKLCHIEDPDKVNQTRRDPLPEFKQTNIPSRWLGKARFSHDKHRLLQCTECHQAEQSSQTTDVLMPGLKSCQECHNPKRGARHDCVECHSYHDRALGKARPGMTIKECLAR